MSAEITTRTVSGYLELFEYMTNVAAFTTLTYSHFFKQNEMLKFMNKIQTCLKNLPTTNQRPHYQNEVFVSFKLFKYVYEKNY